MVRPRKDGLDYFPCDVHFDEKIKAIELLHKNDGLVWIIKFWQMAYCTNSGEVNLNGVFGVIHAENCRITTGKQAEIIAHCVQIGLITETSQGVYTSNGIQKRLNEIVKDREYERKRKLVGNYPAENKPLIGESKVKESKEKKRVSTHPTLEEVKTYFKEKGTRIDPEAFWNYYEARGWKDIKKWKSCLVTWEKRDKPKMFDGKPITRPVEELPRRKPDPKQQEEVAMLIRQTADSLSKGG